MKLSISLLTSLLVSQSVFAAKYICTDKEGNQAELTTMAKNRIQWSEPWHSAESSGEFVGLDTSPYSDYKDYALFQLSDFYRTDDETFMLALSRIGKSKTRTAVVYFVNDDYIEEEVIYNCEQINN